MSQQTLSVRAVKNSFQKREARPELWISADEGGHTRGYAIHATPPVDPAYVDKLGEETGDAVAEATTRLISKFDASVEALTYPRPVPLPDVDIEAVLCHVFHFGPHFVDGRALQSTLGEFSDKVIQPILEDAHEVVAKSFPDVYTVEVGDFDLDPITAGGDVSTCRLVNREAEEIPDVGKVDDDMMATVFDALTEAREPFVHQLIAEPGDGKYHLTSRLAALSPDHTYEGDRGLARLINEGAPADMGRPFEKVGLTSNFNIDIEDYLHINYNHRIDGRTTYSVSIRDAMRKRYDTKVQHEQKIETLKKAVLGHTEFSPLLSGSTGWKSILEDHGYYGRFWIPPAAISYFTQRYAYYYDQNPWDYAPTRQAPVFTPIPTEEIESRTDWGTPDTDLDIDTRHPTDGSDEHLKLGDRFMTFARARGDQINRVEQDGTTLPDQELSPEDGYINVLEMYVEDDIVNVEPEWTNSSKPANILTNVERAVAADRHAILVFASEKLANRAYEALRATHNGTTDYGVRTFQGGAIPEIDGEILVTDEDESRWSFTPDGQLVHVVDGDVVTRCPADADLTEVEHGCATVHEEDGTYVVTTRDGETLTYESERAFKREWSRVTLPHVPIDISYLQYVTLMYETESSNEETGEFREFKPTPEWERASGKKQRYDQFGGTVAEDFLVEAADTQLEVEACHSVMMGLYKWCTNKDAPKKGWFSKGLPDHIERRDTPDGKKALDGYTWLFPRGLVSPHLPSVDTDADLPL
ncbi:hypothetical protein PNP59_09590 [Halobacterium salinarum]|uniref:hypothetical protein n=1 Tax=Halobacterium salinarum TaxID=2242 RepID=UPI00255280EF|nr:hypothetical protein [Halobacterium salinarum]MDL0131182.1 hypothetical protein [Halobacterium salinarum]